MDSTLIGASPSDWRSGVRVSMVLLALALAGMAQTTTGPAADYYAACMDTARIEQLGSRPLGPMLQQVSGLQNTRQLATEIGKLHGSGIYAVFTHAGQAEAPRPYLRTFAFREHVTRLFELLGYPHAAAVEQAVAALGMEATFPPSSSTPSHMTLAQLQKAAPAFHWASYFGALGEPTSAGLDVADPDSLRRLNGHVLVTSLDTWKSYLRWRWLDATALLLSPPFVEEQFGFYAQVLHQAKGVTPARAQVCAAARDAFPASAYLLVPIKTNDYFGDTLALRGWAVRSASPSKVP